MVFAAHFGTGIAGSTWGPPPPTSEARSLAVLGSLGSLGWADTTPQDRQSSGRMWLRYPGKQLAPTKGLGSAAILQ